MDQLLLIIFFGLLLSLILGPLGILPLGLPLVNIYISDILAGALLFCWLLKINLFITYFKNSQVLKVFGLFIGISILSLLLSPIPLTLYERGVSGLYILRVAAYFCIFITGKYLVEKKKISPPLILKSLIVIGSLLAVLGWVQYFLYPDLRNLLYLGWDPHYFRIFATYFDPNYLGLILVLTFIALLTFYKKNALTWPVGLFILITLAFTYSRSSFLALTGAVIFLTFVRKKYFMLGTLVIFFLGVYLFIPRPSGEGGKLGRMFTVIERIDNWKTAGTIFIQHPLIGVGMNTLRFARKQYGYLSDDWLTSHSAAGIDNSFLYVAVTTGIIGICVFILLLIKLFLKTNELGRVTLIAVIIHSLFLNSFFYPWVMVWLWSVLSLSYKNKSNGSR
jgi:hypothetical protein